MLRRTGRWGDRLRRNDAWLAGIPTRRFPDYILKLEFRGSEKVNSGVFLRSQEEAQPHRTGYEIKADDDHFVIVLNGKTLRDARDSKHASGVVGFRNAKRTTGLSS